MNTAIHVHIKRESKLLHLTIGKSFKMTLDLQESLGLSDEATCQLVTLLDKCEAEKEKKEGKIIAYPGNAKATDEAPLLRSIHPHFHIEGEQHD